MGGLKTTQGIFVINCDFYSEAFSVYKAFFKLRNV